MNNILQNTSIINSKRQPPNLKKQLTRAMFSENPVQDYTVTKCLKGNCGTCQHLIEADKYAFKCGVSFKIKIDISCDVKNVIYAIICRGCNKEYVGETNNLRKRITVHKQQIRDPSIRILKVSKHIDECSSQDPKFSVFPFYKMNSDDGTFRKKKELYFIKLLKPELNCN